MKIALYIEDGSEQIVLTPQTKTETAILGRLTDGASISHIYRGEFYGCQGGWTRHREGGEASAIIVIEPLTKDHQS